MADGDAHGYNLALSTSLVNHDDNDDTQVLAVCPLGMMFTKDFLFRKVRFILKHILPFH
jgi:hypothetical protein